MISARLTFRTPFSALALALGAPLALAACSEDAAVQDIPRGEPIAPIAAPEGTAWLETFTVSEDGQGYIVGNPEAPLKLAEYASHTCGACANFAVTGKPSLKEYVETGVVSFEQREVFLNTFDVVIASLARCGPDERFQTLSDEVWQNLSSVMQGIQNNSEAAQSAGQLDVSQRFVRIGEVTGLIDFFAARGLSSDQARMCLAQSENIEAMVEAAGDKANEVGVTGTPTFTLNGAKVDANQWDGLEPILQRAGARQE
ncbi:MAG: thioredoxin domain-containing protein [Erythrobacter sp.]|uniref:thioredoxin domain-containing protein n=1 Tax=Erythrobacter sp. TaxID=1042 RepID=UPI002605CD73|nr:thioredoxin domain-containing protein [Erythrobacter sp.]MDJ0978829.1 thioredoxin domain-containing protein [Erythrobacter sp.]